jgi:hypothetical protein
MSLAKPLFWLTSIYLVVVFVITLLTGIAPLWQFGVAAVICSSMIPVFVAVGKRILRTPADRVTTDLDVLLDYLRLRDCNRRFIANCWVGRQVRITEDVQDARDLLGKPIFLEKGMVGEIIDLNEEPATPFRVRFAEHIYPVDVFVHRLELVPQVEGSA